MSGSPDGVPMTTDVGSRRRECLGEMTRVGIFVVSVLGVLLVCLPRQPRFEVAWEGLGGKLLWGQRARGGERRTDRRRLRYLANPCCPKAEGRGFLSAELAAAGPCHRTSRQPAVGAREVV